LEKRIEKHEEKYLENYIINIDYSLDSTDNPEKNTATTSSLTSSNAACHLAHSRKLSATLGGLTSTCPGVRKITLQTCDFVDISNTAILGALGGSMATSPPIVVVILRQQLDYLYIID
jgi:hypothetical protein